MDLNLAFDIDSVAIMKILFKRWGELLKIFLHKLDKIHEEEKKKQSKDNGENSYLITI